MKQQNSLSSYSVWQKMAVLFSFLSLILALILYIGTAVNIAAIAVLTVVNAAAVLLYLLPGKSRRFVRVIARGLLWLLPIVFLVLIGVYLSILKQYEYIVSLGQTLLFLTVFLESTLFFGTAAWSLLGTQRKLSDLVCGSLFSLGTLVLSVITVVVLSPLTDEKGAYLLSMLFRSPLYDGVFLIGTLLSVIGFIGALVEAIAVWREQKAATAPKRRKS